MTEKFIAAVVGAFLGWAGTSLTLVGRVQALEVGQSRIEQKIDAIGERISKP